ncbi:hypothetical protein ACFX2I_040234 [Malus domestica]
MGKAITNPTSSGNGWFNPHMAAVSRAIAKRIPLVDLVLKFRDAMKTGASSSQEISGWLEMVWDLIPMEQHPLFVATLWQLWRERNKVLHGAEVTSIRWRPPSVGILKLNVDGAINITNGTRGAGGIFRDDRGWLVGAVAMKAPNLVSIRAMELYALEVGISFAVDAG